MDTPNYSPNMEPEFPAFLDFQEIDNPFLVIDDFFDSSCLFSARQAWWDLLYYAFSSEESNGLPAANRAELLFLHKAIGKLVEAACLINKWELQDKIHQIKSLSRQNNDNSPLSGKQIGK